ncbi:MAG: hypothetical protein WBB23_12645 [Desulforhopalus sp.]
MKLDCPHCGVSGSAKDSYTGQKVKCPKCNGVFEVSELEAAEETTVAIKEETLEWEDIASEAEVNLHDAENEESEQEDKGSPAELSPWENEFQKPSDFDLKEDDVEAQDETGKTILPEADLEKPQQDDLELQEDDHLEEPPLHDSAGSKSAEAEVSSQDQENIINDDLQFPQKEVQEVDNLKLDNSLETDNEQCCQCGKKDNAGEPFITKDGGLYCGDCSLLEDLNMNTGTQFHDSDDISPAGRQDIVDSAFMDDNAERTNFDFTIGNLIREAWEKTKGAKGIIWAGSAIMYLVILVTVAGGAFLFPTDVGEIATLTQAIGNALFQTVTDLLSILFTAGLFLMGIKRAAGETIHWKMIFKGFSCAGKIIVTTILQFILISIGFLLLILPGIYLIVGYTMTIPLIIDKGLSPWQAMETSRKAVHKIWWKVLGIFCIMVLIFIVSFIPLGIGLIWTWPMFIILIGVMYQQLFGEEKEERSTYGND